MTARFQSDQRPFLQLKRASEEAGDDLRTRLQAWTRQQSWASRWRTAEIPVEESFEPTFNTIRGWVVLSLLTLALFGWLVVRVVVQPAGFFNLPGGWLETLELIEVAGVFTLTCLWTVLGYRAHKRQQLRNAPQQLRVLSVDQMYALTPYEFEEYVASLFRAKGHTVTRRGGSGDKGVDLEVTDSHGRRAIVQCKRYQSTVGSDVVRELYGTFIHEEAVHAYLATTAEISSAAREWAERKPLTLLDGRALVIIANTLDTRQKLAATQRD